MPNTPPITVLPVTCDQAVRWAISKLEKNGLQTVRTFDLQAARSAHLDCTCPHHGTAKCNCQMVVLLVYQADTHPATLVIHGNEQTSRFYLINAPGQSVEQQMENSIQEVLSLEMETPN